MLRSHGGIGKLRAWLWRWRVLLAIAWIAIHVGVIVALWGYSRYVPASIDAGMTVALRQVAYRDTFRQVERAQQDADRAAAATDPAVREQFEDRASERLELFLRKQKSVQPDRLETHAVVAATELLAALYGRSGRDNKAVKLLSRLAREIPKNYRLHWLAGQAHARAGDLAAAADAYREAFKLAPNHPDVVDDFLDVLSVQNAFEDIVWVADHFDRAVRRGRPSVEVKVGSARGQLQRRALTWSGVPVEHGSYVRSVTLFGLERGERCVLAPPADLLSGWTHGGPLFVQLRFEGVYEGLAIDGFRYWTGDAEPVAIALDAATMVDYHRPHSGVEWYFEIRTDLDPQAVERFEIVYRCPELAMSRASREIVDKAVANLGARR